MLRHYTKENLPGDIRRLVESKHCDFSIHNVSEITRGDKIVYTINLEGKIPCKTIKIADGEMETMEEYLKANKEG